jgi:flagellar biosynthesis protein FliR
MEAGLTDLIAMAQAPTVTLFAVFLRVGAAMALMPGFGEQAVPVRVRLLLGIAFTLIVWPLAGPALPTDLQTIHPIFFVTEAVAGLAMGIFFRLFVMVLQLAGMMAAQATSLSQIFGGGATPDPMPAFGNLLVIGGLALAMISGLHIKLALALAQSYSVMPLGAFPTRSDLADWGVSGVTQAFNLAFSLASPFIIASVIYNVALGAINRAMPQLMVAFVGAPAITFGGLVLLAITAPAMLVLWLQKFDIGLSAPFGAGF